MFGKIHWPFSCSIQKNFTPDRKNLHRHHLWCLWQIWGMYGVVLKSCMNKFHWYLNFSYRSVQPVYSVRWYKGGKEFYSFLPGNSFFHQRCGCAPSVQPIYDEENPARQGVSHLSAPDEGGEGGRLQVEHHLCLSLLRFYLHHRTLSMWGVSVAALWMRMSS